MHQITAYGGTRGPSPFQQAIVQSPGWLPLPDPEEQEDTLQEFLGILGVNTVEEARQLPSDKLLHANSYQVAMTKIYGAFTYGPVVDGTFVPKMPGKLLAEGGFDHNLNIMVGHNADEGLLFTPPSSLNASNFPRTLHKDFADITSKVATHITKDLYPPVFDGSEGYNNSIERVALATSDVVFVCNTDYLNRAYNGRTHAYEFSIPPALHGEDVPYTFYTGGGPSMSVLNTTVALAMQDYFTSFVENGVPESNLGPEFPEHGTDGKLLNFGLSDITVQPDPTDNKRCSYWQTVPYYNP